jgi:hypothetical protein
MNLYRTPRHFLATLGALIAVGAACCASASASTYGELTRFGARQEQLPDTGTPVSGGIAGKAKEGERHGEELPGPELNYGIGVDPSEGNAVFVLDEPKEPEEKELPGERDSVTRHVRIQKFNPATKAVEATREFTVTSPANVEESVEEIEGEEFSNIAIDAEKGVLYVLSEERRKYKTKPDEEAPVAMTLYAFNTKELGFAAHTSEGVLANAEALKAESTATGAALIEPRGITVDPKTHDVIIVAHEDSEGKKIVDEVEKPADHFVLQRVSDEGKLGERYIDKKNYFKTSRVPDEYPSSPVVTSAGHVLVRFGTEGITEVPSDFEAATKAETEPTALFTEPQNVVPIDEPEVESEAGGALSISPEGDVFEPSSVVNEAEVLKAKDNGLNWGVAKRTAEGSLLGWSGGQSALISEELSKANKTPNTDECVLQPDTSKEPLMDVAAGSGGDVFVLSPEFLEVGESFVTTMAVIELGPGGKGCPTAAGSAVAVLENGKPLGAGETVEAGTTVQVSTTVDQADALEAEWTFKNETTHEAPIVKKPNPLEFVTETGLTGVNLLLQQPILNISFPTAGQYLVTAKVHTDDLGSEQVEAKSITVNVEAKAGTPLAPKVTRQPTNASVTEPAKATFLAEASGSPKPKVQWQLSTEKGKWTNISGATTDTLTIESTKVAESGREYRAVFTNTLGEATSNPATLTVKEKESTSPPPEEKLSTTTTTTTTPIVNVLPHVETKAAAVPAAVVAGTSVKVTPSGALSVKVSCPAGETTCLGTVTLRTLTAVSAGAKAGAAKAKRAILTLASGSFSVTGGGTQTIKLHLSSAARKLLAHSHTLRVRATLVAHDPAGGKHTGVQVLTLRLAKR